MWPPSRPGSPRIPRRAVRPWHGTCVRCGSGAAPGGAGTFGPAARSSGAWAPAACSRSRRPGVRPGAGGPARPSRPRCRCADRTGRRSLAVHVLGLHRLYRRTSGYQRDIEQLAGEDALTGMANRRQFMVAGTQLLERVHRYGRPASLLVMDLDHFKSINDRYGHAAGDVALQAAARLLREHQRGADLAARLGGEEFAMLLPETDLDGAAALAERLRAGCEALRLDVPGGALTGVRVTR